MAATEPHYGYRPTPQLSANQLAEYLMASAPRRASIIRAARFPKTAVVAQYDKAREGLVEFLADGARSLNHLARALENLARREGRPAASTWIIRDSRFSQEAIEVFQRGYNRLGLPRLNCRAIHGRQPPLVFGPTKVSVTLDVTTHKPVSGERDHVGGAILVFSRGEKSSKSRIDRCKTIAGLIYLFCAKHLAALGEADPSICLAIDVFNSTPHVPPGTFARKLRQIEHSCEEIGSRWKTIKAPADYDGPDYE